MKLCKEEFVTLAENITENSYQETNLSPETIRYYKVGITAQKDDAMQLVNRLLKLLQNIA